MIFSFASPRLFRDIGYPTLITVIHFISVFKLASKVALELFSRLQYVLYYAFPNDITLFTCTLSLSLAPGPHVKLVSICLNYSFTKDKGIQGKEGKM
jgi:hypothetical protein